ncbi:Y+L amino acid transporter 1 [Holothuria leucospilota]|uniref:Y+L amino acid transporter 1 n=1 Tax=Holothuria leucospilota TaxID=206669 RepID=A0A9Q1CA41_HOLLE|nr:Y+L amino acid transporter 1 [Holothuria leucospilota]
MATKVIDPANNGKADAGKDNVSENGSAVGLKRELGLFNSVTLIVGCIVGSGIFLSPKSVVENTGSVGLSLVVWSLSGVFSLVGALCFAELGTTIPKSGGEYSYLMDAFGPFPAFLLLWVTLIIINPTGQTIVALTFAEYVIQPFFPQQDCGDSDTIIRIIAVLCLAILALINAWSVPWSTKVQDIFTVAKVLALVAIIITGAIFLFQGETSNFQNSFEGTLPGSKVALAFYGGLFSYAGWNYLNYLTEEIKDPYRNLPLAIAIAIPLITIIYILANIAYFAVLTKEELMQSDAVALTFAIKAYGPVAWIMPICVAMSTFGSVNGGYLSLSRIFYVGARQGQLPKFMAMIQVKNFTPLPSLLFTLILSIFYVFVPSIDTLLNYFSFMTWFAIGLAVVGQIYLRYKQPNLKRPIKFHILLPISFVLMCAYLVIMGTYAAPFDTLFGVLITLSGIPVYFLFVRYEKKPTGFENFVESTTEFFQKLFLVALENRKQD